MFPLSVATRPLATGSGGAFYDRVNGGTFTREAINQRSAKSYEGSLCE